MKIQGTDEELKKTTDEEPHTGYYQANTSKLPGVSGWGANEDPMHRLRTQEDSQMKGPHWILPGQNLKCSLEVLVGEQMKIQGTDEELKKTTDEEPHTGYYRAKTSSVAWSFWLGNRRSSKAQIKNSRSLQMKGPDWILPGQNLKCSLEFLVGEQMKIQATDEGLKKTTDEGPHTGYYRAKTSSVAWSFWLGNR